MSDLIDREVAFEVLTDYYHHRTYVQKLALKEGLSRVPSAEPNNQVHLCIFCKHGYPECQAEMSDIIFGNGIGHDNVCACAKFEIKPEREAKVYKKQAPDRLYYFYCGVCGEMIDCSFYEDYKSIKSYCGYCGAKLDWSNHE